METKTARAWQSFILSRPPDSEISKLYSAMNSTLLKNQHENLLVENISRIPPDRLKLILMGILQANILVKNLYGLKQLLKLFSRFIDLSYLLNPAIFNNEKLIENISREIFVHLWVKKIIPLVKEVLDEKQGNMAFKRKSRKGSGGKGRKRKSRKGSKSRGKKKSKKGSGKKGKKKKSKKKGSR